MLNSARAVGGRLPASRAEALASPPKCCWLLYQMISVCRRWRRPSSRLKKRGLNKRVHPPSSSSFPVLPVPFDNPFWVIQTRVSPVPIRPALYHSWFGKFVEFKFLARKLAFFPWNSDTLENRRDLTGFSNCNVRAQAVHPSFVHGSKEGI